MATPFISPEARLVFGTANPAGDQAFATALLRGITNWARVGALAERELASYALWLGMKDCEAGVPGDFLEALARSALQTDLRMQQLARRLRQTIEGLSAAGIPCLLLKGAAIGALGDATFRRRPMTDIDLFVHREDAARASETFRASGWSVTDNPVYREMLRDAHHLPHFVDALQPGIRLELHVALMPDDQPFAFDEAMLWRDARPAPAPFDGARIPSPVHLLLHTCVHFAWQHRMTFGGWRTFRSVVEITQAGGFDWARLASTATEVRAGTACYWTLRLAKALGGVGAPPDVLGRLEPPTPEWMRRALERHFIAALVPGEGPSSPSERISDWLWRAAMRPSWSGYAGRGSGDRDARWVEALGTGPRESSLERVRRHARSHRAWLEFLSGTLFRRG